MGRLIRMFCLGAVVFGSILVSAPISARSFLADAAASDMVIIARDVTDLTQCTAALTAVDPHGRVTTLWSGQCGQGPIGGAVIAFSIVPRAEAAATDQMYEPLATGATGQQRLATAVLDRDYPMRSRTGVPLGPIVPNGLCNGTTYHATANVTSQAHGAPNATMHLDQAYQYTPDCSHVAALTFSYSKNSGATVYRSAQSLLYDNGGPPIAYGGDTGCYGPLGSSSGYFGGTQAPTYDFNRDWLDSVAWLSSSCSGTYDWDLLW